MVMECSQSLHWLVQATQLRSGLEKLMKELEQIKSDLAKVCGLIAYLAPP